MLEDAKDEIKKMKLCSGNDHVIKIIDYFYDSSEFYLNVVMELCSGSLRGLLDKNKKFSYEELVEFMTQITAAFLELESKKLMHLDMKPENILTVDKEGKYFKLCDFGCSQLSDISRLSGYENTVFGTFNYLAPEVYLNLKGKKKRSSADIWSFGITLYEMIFGRLPFTKGEEKEVDRDLAESYCLNKGYVIDYRGGDDLPEKIFDILKKMLVRDPMDRITWEGMKKELMINFKVPEHLFMNIKDSVKMFVPVTETYMKVVKVLGEGPKQKEDFWKVNSAFLKELREKMLYYFYILCVHYESIFEAKVDIL